MFARAGNLLCGRRAAERVAGPGALGSKGPPTPCSPACDARWPLLSGRYFNEGAGYQLRVRRGHF